MRCVVLMGVLVIVLSLFACNSSKWTRREEKKQATSISWVVYVCFECEFSICGLVALKSNCIEWSDKISSFSYVHFRKKNIRVCMCLYFCIITNPIWNLDDRLQNITSCIIYVRMCVIQWISALDKNLISIKRIRFDNSFLALIALSYTNTHTHINSRTLIL